MIPISKIEIKKITEPFCFIGVGNDCAAESMPQNMNGVLTISNDSITKSNIQISNLITNVLINSAISCNDSMISNQFISIDESKYSSAHLDFRCVNPSNAGDVIVAEIVSNLIISLQNTSGSNNDVLTVMGSVSQPSTGFVGITNSPYVGDYAIVMKNKYNALNNYQKNIVNAIANSLQKSFSATTISSCVSYVIMNQLESPNITSVESEMESVPVIDINTAKSLIINYINQSNISSSVTQDFLNTFGIQLKSPSSTSTINPSTSYPTPSQTSNPVTTTSTLQDVYVPIIIFLAVVLFIIICGLSMWGASKVHAARHSKEPA